MNVPFESNFCIRLFPVSATYTLSDESMAMAVGFLNYPFSVPDEPHCLRNEYLKIYC